MRDKTCNIAKNPKYDGYQCELTSVVYKCFAKKSASLADKYDSGSDIKNENTSNIELAEKLHKSIIIKFEKRKVDSPFIKSIWGADPANIQLISKFNKGIRFLLYVIDIYSKYTWVLPLNNKKSITITNAFLKVLDESNCKRNKIWVEKGSEFYNKSVKSWLEKNYIEMHSTDNEKKTVIAEIFITTLKNKTYKYLALISNNMYIDKLDDINNKYNSTYHRTIKLKPVDAKHVYCLNKERNKESPKCKVCDHIRISKYKNVFAKDYVRNWSEEFFVIKKVKKNTVLWTYLITDLKSEEISRTCYEKELQKIKEKVFWIEKVIKRKGDKLYVKWKGYNNSWIDKRDIVLKSEYFPKPKSLGTNVKIELDLSNYATKADLKKCNRR